MSVEQLKAIVGDNNILFREHELLSYTRDASQISGSVICVVLPKSTDEVQKIVHHARRHHIDIVPRGGGTSLTGGAVPQNSIVLDLSRMCDVISLDLINKKVTVGAGMVCDELNQYLLPHGLMYPVIPSSSAAATIGGMLSTNAAGLWAFKYGSAEKWVSSIEVVDGNNMVHSFSDSDKMMRFIGMEGTTGIITQATLTLVSKHQGTSMRIYTAGTISALMKFLAEETSPSLLSLEYIDDLTARYIGMPNAFHLVALYDDPSFGPIQGHEVDAIMTQRKAIGPALTSKGYSIMEDPKVPLDKREEFLHWLHNNNIPTFGHIGIGVVHPRFRDAQKTLIHDMFVTVHSLGGSVTGEHGIGLLKNEFVSSDFLNKVRQVKSQYDPENILNKNKIFALK